MTLWLEHIDAFHIHNLYVCVLLHLLPFYHIKHNFILFVIFLTEKLDVWKILNVNKEI